MIQVKLINKGIWYHFGLKKVKVKIQFPNLRLRRDERGDFAPREHEERVLGRCSQPQQYQPGMVDDFADRMELKTTNRNRLGRASHKSAGKGRRLSALSRL